MNVICVGYFDKHARYFLDINKWLERYSNKKIRFKYFSIHFSGFLYSILRLRQNSFISSNAWIKANFNKKTYNQIIASQESYKGIDFSRYLNFHLNLTKLISRRALQRQALAYIDLFEKAYDTIQPDLIISVGDSRLCVEIAIAVAKQKGIKCYYIEQGPFDTTFFDEQGVNANLSKRQLSTNSNHHQNIKNQETVVTKKYLRSPIYRGFDILLMKLFENTYLYPPDLKFTDLNTYKSKSKKSQTKLDQGKFALFAMQVPLDVNMVYHSPHYKSHLDIIKDISINLPDDIELIVREHPLYVGKYEKAVYDFIREHNIIIDNESTLDDALTNAELIIVNNSTVGIEAIKKYKSVIVLGDAFYDNEEVCLKLKSRDELSDLLKMGLNRKVDKNKIDNYIKMLYDTIKIEGSISDETLTSSKKIANILISKL